MMNTKNITKLAVATCVSAVLAAAGTAAAQTLTTVPVASGLTRPMFVTAPRGDFNRIFVVEQRSGSTGRIRIVNIPGNTLNATPFLSISGVATASEQGLLGLAFHPNFMQNGYFYVNYTRTAQSGISAGSTIVARYRATGGVGTALTADPTSATVLMTILQPENNHNGGWMDFGPDGMLYIATGDGGNGNDVNGTGTVNPPGHTATIGNAQDLTNNLLGKMLRIDVDGPDNIPGNADDADSTLGLPYRIPANNPYNGTNGDREIMAYGLRNPWRNSFDRDTGDLWIADVGQGVWEEVNVVQAGGLAGLHFGWKCLEGLACTNLTGCSPCPTSGRYNPIHVYNHNESRCSITGGYVYRGCAIPSFRGQYIFADYCSSQIYTLQRGATFQTPVSAVDRTAELDPAGSLTLSTITSFGEDALGELYICDFSGGRVYKIVESAFSQPDCNANNIADACEIASGGVPDANSNGIPDGCETSCYADYNEDGGIDGADVEAFFTDWSNGGEGADVNQDGGIDGADVETFFTAWSNGSC